jgi:hypothetical protein
LAWMGALPREMTHLLRGMLQKSSSRVRERQRADNGFARFLREYEAKNKASEPPEKLGPRARFVH